MAEKVKNVGVTKQSGFLYFLDNVLDNHYQKNHVEVKKLQLV